MYLLPAFLLGFFLFPSIYELLLTLQLLPEEYEAVTKSMSGAHAAMIHVHPTNRRHYIGIRTERLNNNNTTG